MASVALEAHFDGERIVLDEPAELAPNARLLVTVLPEDDAGAREGSQPPKFDYAERLKAIYGEYVMPDDEFDELLHV